MQSRSLVIFVFLCSCAATISWARTSLQVAGGNDACSAVRCMAGSHCHVRHGVATCTCLPSCPRLGTPVCASDGHSYRSKCELQRTSCRRGVELRVTNIGPCPAPRASAGKCKVARQKVLLSRLSSKDVLRSPGCAEVSLSVAQWQRCLQVSGVLGPVSAKHITPTDVSCARCLFSAADLDVDSKVTREEISRLLAQKTSKKHDLCRHNCKHADLLTEDCRGKCSCSAAGTWSCSSAQCGKLTRQHVKSKHRMKLVKAKEWDDVE